MADEEEVDYMSMAIVEPAQQKEKETYTQRRIRKEREAEKKGRIKSKKELEADVAAAREAALSSSLSSGSRGYKMMARLGFKHGEALGAAANPAARLEPVTLNLKEDRGGVGMDSDRKRKVREQLESETKRIKAEEHSFRERIAQEREEKRLEGVARGAMNIAESMSAEGKETSQGSPIVKIQNVNVLWRRLVRERMEKERENLRRQDLSASLPKRTGFNEEDDDDSRPATTLDDDLDEEDPELDAFSALSPGERLERLVLHLRQTHNYCFWCKQLYPNSDLAGCPGLTEQDHE